jgi:hypothetical protein
MTKKIASILGLFMTAGITLPARTASAKIEVSIFKLHDRSLLANFEDASDDGCFVTQTSIQFSESVTQIGGPPIIGAPTTLVTLDYANACTGESFELLGGTTVQTFHIASDLSSATLTTVVPVVDDSGANSASVTINVKWTANAPLQVAKNSSLTRNANTIIFERTEAEARSADVLGPVSTVLNLQAGPTGFDLSRFPEGGQLGKNVDGQRTVTFLRGHH